jgi:ribose 5-phosphate isomerase A
MLLGLGSGSTVKYFTEGVGRMVADGLRVRGVPTSRATAALAAELGIPIVEELIGQIDLAVDGADEVDPKLSLIKGAGGAHLREKLVAVAARRFVIVVDESKLVDKLGHGVVPVEVSPFLWRLTAERLARRCTGLKVRGGEEEPYVTDNDNLILDLSFDGGIDDPDALGSEIKSTVGVMEHGLFVGLADTCIVAGPAGPRVLGGPL